MAESVMDSIALTERQRRLLLEVAAGKTTHRCASWSPRQLETFQPDVDDLLRLDAMGYLNGCEALAEPRLGMGYVNRVYVRGGLTEEGWRLVESLVAPVPESRQAA